MSNFDQVVAALDTNSVLNIYVLCGGQIWLSVQQSGGWSDWSLLPFTPQSNIFNQIAVASDNSKIYSIKTDGSSQAINPTATAVSSWSSAGIPNPSEIAVNVFGPSSSQKSTQLFYTTSNGTYTQQGGSSLTLDNTKVPAALAACTNSDGRLFCFLADGTTVFNIPQQSSGGSWNAAESIGQPSPNVIGSLAAAPRSDGLIVFASDSSGAIFFNWKTSASGSYAGWVQQDVPQPQQQQQPIKTLALAPLANGLLQLFAIDNTHGHLWNRVFDPASSSSSSLSWTGDWDGPMQLVIPITATVAINSSDLNSSTWSYSSSSNSPNLSANGTITVDTPTTVIFIDLQLAQESTGSITLDQTHPVLWSNTSSATGNVPTAIKGIGDSLMTATFRETNDGDGTSYGFRINAQYKPAGGGTAQPLTSPDPTIVEIPVSG